MNVTKWRGNSMSEFSPRRGKERRNRTNLFFSVTEAASAHTVYSPSTLTEANPQPDSLDHSQPQPEANMKTYSDRDVDAHARNNLESDLGLV